MNDIMPMTMPIIDDDWNPFASVKRGSAVEFGSVRFIDVVGVCEIDGGAVFDMQLTFVDVGVEAVFFAIGLTIVVTSVVTIVVRDVLSFPGALFRLPTIDFCSKHRSMCGNPKVLVTTIPSEGISVASLRKIPENDK